MTTRDPERDRLAERLATLSPAQRRLLERRLRREGLADPAAEPTLSPLPPIPPIQGRLRRTEATSFPLSFGQQRLWFIDQVHPGSPAYNLPFAGRLEGELQVPALAWALGEMGRRHEALRTRFVQLGGQPVQIVEPPAAGDAELPVIDLSALPAPRRGAEAGRVAEEEARAPFDLSAGPPVRLALLRLEAGIHDLLVTLPHIVTDAWSMGVFFRELPVLYGAALDGGSSPLAPLPLQAADHALWQREWLGGEVLEILLGYWRRRLEGAPLALDLPFDRPRPRVQTLAGARHPLALPAALADALRDLGGREQATLFMTLLAAYGVLLGRHAGRRDVLVGSPFAARNPPEIEGLIGFFVNTLVFRMEMGGDPSFRELLERVRAACLGAYAHQGLPFERLVDALITERDPSRPPLVQATLVLQNVSIPEPDFRGLTLSRLQQTDTRTSKVDLMFGLWESPAGPSSGPEAWLEYNTDLFDRSTVARLAGHLLHLLEAVAADPARRLSELPMLSEAERRELLVEWNATERPFPARARVHEMFEAWAERAPDAVAVEARRGSLTYRELDRRAGRLAGALRRMGVGPDVLVALAADRSPDMVVGIVAVLKAGGAWLPLDPENPGARLRSILEDSGAAFLLASPALEASLAAAGLPASVRRVSGADAQEAAEEVPRAGAKAPGGPESLAYVIYTSGSTGRPKGVLVEHRGLTNLAYALVHDLGVGPEDRVLQFASPAFDAAVWEIWMALATGARLCLAQRAELLPGPELAFLLRQREITHITLPPSALAALPEMGPEELPALRVVCAAGEACPAGLRHWARGGRRLLNAYGPTEATVCATLADLSAEGDRPAIGRPLPNVRAYVLDTSSAEPLPVGVAGELCVGGAGLARGYAGRPDLTAQRFVPDPFGPPGTRLYRTGDLARFLPDGNLDYLGRIDDQIKVRGFRIEPAEVESALLEHPGVREAAVIVEDGRLSAFLVPSPGERDVLPSLRPFLAERLPEAMLPGVFVLVESLPRSPSGKLDRRALAGRVPAETRRSGRAPYAPPRNPVEEELARLWAEVLRVDRVGIEDNFFALGGDSILGIQMIGRAVERGIRLAPRQLFERPTVAGLAEEAETEAGPATRDLPAAERRPARASLPPEVPASGIEAVYPLSPMQEGMLFHSLYAPRSGMYIEQSSCRIEGPLHITALELAWRRAVERHPVLRTSFHLDPVRPVQRVHTRADLPWWQEDWRPLNPADQERRFQIWMEMDARHGFDLNLPPLMRLLLVRVGPESYRFLWTNHHLILDGWSLSILLREVFASYDLLTRGEPVRPGPFPEPLPYRAYVEWLEAQDPAAAETFWRRELAGFTVPTPLAALEPETRAWTADEPGPADQQERERCLRAADTERLHAVARRAGLTPHTLVAGAWTLLLARYSGEPEVVFGEVFSGRPPHLTGDDAPLGLFINTLPVRARVRPGDRLLPWLERLQARQGELSRFSWTPLASVQAWSEVARGLPLFESLLTFESYPRDASLLEINGIRVSELRTLERTNYPLNLTAVPGDRLALRATWNRRRFDGAAVERMLGHLVNLLSGLMEQLAEPPEGTVDGLPLLAPEERAVLTAEWNDTGVSLPGRCAHELVEAVAALTPMAQALAWEGGAMSYAELDRRANRLARHLRGLGVRPEARVAVALDRSPELIVTLLAVWKAGGAWVPLDPSYPVERLGVQLGDCDATALVTVESLAAGLIRALPGNEVGFAGAESSAFSLRSPLRPLRLARLDADAEEIAMRSAEPLRIPMAAGQAPDGLAYILYTSGSTGRPKGVMGTHRGLCNLVWGLSRVAGYRPGPGERVLQLAAPGFDVSLAEVLIALANGAALHLAPVARLAGEALGHLLAERAITHLMATPSALAAVPPRELPALRVLDVGADVVPADLARRWTAPGRLFFDGYGPTEATVTATLGEVELAGGTPRIGRPLANVRALVLDDRMEPVPVGIAGELYLGGAGLARGYWGRPDLTAARFVPDPHTVSGGKRGERLYRTGDRVRRLQDGRLDFLGRLDRQIKVRGVRIEPAEVEAELARHPAVREAAVVLEKDRERRLVAYLVASTQDSVALRAFLRSALPDPMVPSAFVFLDALPRTKSGKVDFHRLPEPPAGPVRPERTAIRVAPRTPAERALAEIWAEVLGVDSVCVEDDFFDLGGDSILSLQVIGRAAEAGFRLDPKMIFENPSVAALAAVAPRVAAAEPEKDDPAGPVPLTPIQSWFFGQDLPEPRHWNMPLLLELAERPSAARTARAVSALLDQHDALRARFEKREEVWVQEIAPPGGPLPFEYRDLSGLADGPARQAVEAAAAELQSAFDLENGPLFRAVLFDLGPGRASRLLLLAHHLVVDAVSWRVLLGDLETAYGQLRRGEDVVLAPKTTSFRRWARRLSDRARSAEVRRELPHWEAAARGCGPRLPLDHADGINTESSAAEVRSALDVATTRSLLHEVPDAYGTHINDVLLTALVEALAPWTGERVLCLDLEGHGREAEEGFDLSRTVGWFTAVFPVRLDLRGTGRLGGALKSVKEQLRAIPGRGIGYGLLRYLASDPQVAAGLAPTTPPQILFNYLGQLDAALDGRGVALARESAGPPRGPRGARSHVLEINAHVLGGRLEVVWSFSESLHARETIERLAEAFLRELAALVEHCQTVDTTGTGSFTPSDFPDAEVDQKSLDKLLTRLSRTGRAGGGT